MITIKDVAKRAGVSIATVSRVINQSPSVTEQSIQRVQQAIDELGYQPNSIARSLQLGHSGLIGMIVPQLDHPFFSRLVEAAEQRCVEHGCRLVLCCSNSEDTREKEFVQMLRRNRVDGMLIATRTPNLGYLDGYDIPVVGVERSIASNVPFVACDNYTGGVLAAQALLSRGSKHPAVITTIGGVFMVDRDTLLLFFQQNGIYCYCYDADCTVEIGFREDATPSA